jgi:hypothetical protein
MPSRHHSDTERLGPGGALSGHQGGQEEEEWFEHPAMQCVVALGGSSASEGGRGYLGTVNTSAPHGAHWNIPKPLVTRVAFCDCIARRRISKRGGTEASGTLKCLIPLFTSLIPDIFTSTEASGLLINVRSSPTCDSITFDMAMAESAMGSIPKVVLRE